MIDRKVFNHKISEIEKLQNSSASETIKLIKRANKYHCDFYNFFDIFGYELGLGFLNIPVYHKKTDKLLGYIPTLKYYPNNVFNENETYKELCSNYTNLKSSSELLAKETLYQILRYGDLENFVDKIA